MSLVVIAQVARRERGHAPTWLVRCTECRGEHQVTCWRGQLTKPRSCARCYHQRRRERLKRAA